MRRLYTDLDVINVVVLRHKGVSYRILRESAVYHVLENAYCRGCPIYEGEERERRMRARDLALKLNEKHVPKTIKVLFVGESPPKNLMREEEPYSYLYASGPERPKGLVYYISQVLFGGVLAKDEFFKRFREEWLLSHRHGEVPDVRAIKRGEEEGYQELC
jgi:hypothetical protein